MVASSGIIGRWSRESILTDLLPKLFLVVPDYNYSRTPRHCTLIFTPHCSITSINSKHLLFSHGSSYPVCQQLLANEQRTV
jgi:hypothetical protein